MTTGTTDSATQNTPHPITPKSRVRPAIAIVLAVAGAAIGQVSA
ncbi:hypothetical protein [Nocardia sp. CA-135398]